VSALGRLARRALLATWGTAANALARVGGWPRDRPGPLPVVLHPGDPPTFPDPVRAGAAGLVAIGGDLSPRRLLAAYRAGIFPWYSESSPILWWSPDPRAVFEVGGLHVSRRLARTVRSGRFTATFDRAFPRVIRGCAEREEGTWITEEMAAAYEELHRRGHAHSVEVWRGGELAGGVYGVTVGGLFAGESMFSRARDASKVALVHLMEHLGRRGYVLFDIQMLTEHTASLGAVEVPRGEYLRRLREAVGREVSFLPEEASTSG
jgi:leucyl/phenylalanyl-tRNA---protein transferase